MKLTNEELREIAKRAEKAKETTENYSIISSGEVGEVVIDIPRLLAHIAALEEESKRYKEVLRDVRDNYDCDSDAHKYGTTCRCCAAEEVLAEDEERRIQQLERLETAELKYFREEGGR